MVGGAPRKRFVTAKKVTWGSTAKLLFAIRSALTMELALLLESVCAHRDFMETSAREVRFICKNFIYSYLFLLKTLFTYLQYILRD